MPFGNHRPSKAGFYPIDVKGWRATELMRVPLARQGHRGVRNNLLHAERVELVSFKQG